MDSNQLAILKTELTVDPIVRNYSAMTDAQVVTSLQTVNRTPNRKIIPAREVIEATVAAEWAALNAAEKQRYQTITGAGDIDVEGTNTRAAFLAMFGAGTQTRTNLAALQTGPAVSREKELGLPNVGAHHVAIARA